ncbi:MAG TPA: uroporphyrinogen-III C-methyltransferase [Caldimonas sp.]|jgi:uroporphyrin-III C-methyltransferase|nr:uroporphyrinogen-III C-methyltransferase [Caldimonas sp.]HEX4235473.1 uroporphyrinogen-III C-methyltransferase [Caldimonas sp.]
MTGPSSRGSVAFVGAGPGQADLITLRGAERLRGAEVVLFDALADPALRALAPDARWIDVGKRGFAGVPHAPGGGRENTGQETINALLVKHASDGKRVVRLKGGDPSIFGRLEEELAALAAAGIACEVVPGVTAALAAAAATCRPLTRRGAGRSVALTTAVTEDGRLGAGRHADTEVFYMAGKQLAGLARKLAEAGWPAATAALAVSRAGWPDELASEHTVATLGDATVLHSGRPTVVTVGVGATAIAGDGARLPVAAASMPAELVRATP